MRLLLTSDGLTNNEIVEALRSVAFKPVTRSRVAFIPTSANMKSIDKRWLLTHMRQVERAAFEIFDIVDIAALPLEVTLERLRCADVIVFGGGDTKYLMQAIEDCGIVEHIPELIEGRVYVGISAGSIVAGPDTTMGSQVNVWNGGGDEPGHPALRLVEDRVRPHYNRPDFPDINYDNIERVSKRVDGPVYALDDQSALLVVDGERSIVGRGNPHVFD